MRIPWVCSLLGLLSCEPEIPETPPPAAPPTAAAIAGSRFEPARRRWTNLLTTSSDHWVQTVNGLNTTVATVPDSYTRPAAGVFLQTEDGAELDETALRAELADKGLTVIQLLTPEDTGVEGGYVLECAAFG